MIGKPLCEFLAVYKPQVQTVTLGHATPEPGSATIAIAVGAERHGINADNARLELAQGTPTAAM